MGLKAEFLDGRFNASAALFQLDQDNFAQPTGGKTPDGQDAYRALMGVRTKGYELEMSGQLAEGWQVQGGFSHKIARQAGAKVTTLEPENQFSLHTSYRLRGDWKEPDAGRWRALAGFHVRRDQQPGHRCAGRASHPAVLAARCDGAL